MRYILFVFLFLVGCAAPNHPVPGTWVYSVDVPEGEEEKTIFLQELQVDGIPHWLVYLPAITSTYNVEGKPTEFLTMGTDKTYLRPKKEFKTIK